MNSTPFLFKKRSIFFITYTMKRIYLLTILVALLLMSCHRKVDISKIKPGDIIALNEAIKSEPENAALYNLRAEFYASEQKFDDAITDLNKAIELTDDKFDLYVKLSGIYILNGSPQQALEALNKSLELKPDNIPALNKKAKLYFIMKDYENCAAAVEKVLSIDKGNAEALYIKGNALEEAGEIDKAVEAYQEALLDNSKHYESLLHLGYIFLEKDINLAKDYFANAVKINPQSTEALYNLAMIAQENNHPNDALKLYENMLKINPSDKLALYNSGYVQLVYLQDFVKAISFFNQVILVDSTYADAYFNRGYSYELAGDKPAAKADYQKVLQLNPDDKKVKQRLNSL
jgi:tetratricopeptide (TPR) repeat protein